MPADQATAAVSAAGAATPRQGPVPSALRATGHPDSMVARVTGRKAVRSGAVWGLAFGAYVAVQAQTYVSAFPTAASRAALARSVSSSNGLSVLAGPPFDVATVPGCTAWKCLAVLSVTAAVWGALTATKALRGEEEAGRWELLLAGPTTPRQGAVQAVAGLGAGTVAFFAGAAVGIVAIGQRAAVGFGVGPSLFFAFACVSGAMMFAALGCLTSQLAATRRQAAGYAGGAVGVAYAIRMVGDSTASLSWMRWLSPFGWVEQLRPFARPDPWAALPIVAFAAVTSAVAVHLAGRRDLLGSTFPDRSRARAHTTLLNGPVGLGVRLVRPTILGWFLGLAAMSALLGAVAKVSAKSLEDSKGGHKALVRLTGGEHAVTKTYLGISFLILAVMVVLIAATLVSSMRREESLGYLDHLVVRPYSRLRWFWGRLAVAAAIVTAAGFVAGTATWVGAAADHAGAGLASLLSAGLNIVFPSLCLLGVGGVVMGAWPRLATAAMYAALAWSFLVELLGSLAVANRWLLDTSVFHQISPAPAVAPDWTSGIVTVALGVAAAAAGALVFARRDLVGD